MKDLKNITHSAMKREDKIKKRKEKSLKRAQKNIDRNNNRWARNGRYNDCPFDVDMNGLHGTCTCGGTRREECAGDI